MSKLPNEVKVFVVTRLARFDTPQLIANLVKEYFGIAVTRQTIDGYNPDRPGAKTGQPAEMWVKIFRAEREKAKKDIDSVGGSHLAVRVARLDRMATKLEEKGNTPAAAAILQQIAADIGGMYTNQRRVVIEDPAGELAKLVGATKEEIEGST